MVDGPEEGDISGRGVMEVQRVGGPGDLTLENIMDTAQVVTAAMSGRIGPQQGTVASELIPKEPGETLDPNRGTFPGAMSTQIAGRTAEVEKDGANGKVSFSFLGRIVLKINCSKHAHGEGWRIFKRICSISFPKRVYY